jgi:hypothetical protein
MMLHLLVVLAGAGVLLAVVYVVRAWTWRGATAASLRERRLGGVLLFSAPGCAACSAQARILAEFDPLVEHVDALEQRERARAYRVLSVPTTVVIDHAGAVAAIHHGLVDADTIGAALG